MHKPEFEIVSVGGKCYTINDGGRTVALVSSQGYIDWLLRSPMEPGALVTSIRKETHLCYTLGLKLLLTTPNPGSELTAFAYALEDGGTRLKLTGQAKTADGRFATETVAVIGADHAGARYAWDCHTKIACTAKEPVQMPWIEFNNVYPNLCGCCFLYEPVKKFNCTLMVDRDGVAWRFPHQHLMHYTDKINQLQFADGTMAGFFGEPTGSPVVVIKHSSLQPDWAICDMYYDLHCGARTTGPIQPGQTLEFAYEVKYLPKKESDALLKKAKPVPVTEEDWKTHDYPRLELGKNGFLRSVSIDKFDDASGFRQRPPQKVWDREVGSTGTGSLRITNEKAEETVWSADPPSQIPGKHKLRINARVKTQGVEGKGVYLRLRYHTFVWHPRPHVEWVKNLQSDPVKGTTSGWVTVTIPELDVPEEHFDYLLCFDVILDGKGVAWVTDVDIDLQESPGEPQAVAEGGKEKKMLRRAHASAASGTAD